MYSSSVLIMQKSRTQLMTHKHSR